MRTLLSATRADTAEQQYERESEAEEGAEPAETSGAAATIECCDRRDLVLLSENVDQMTKKQIENVLNRPRRNNEKQDQQDDNPPVESADALAETSVADAATDQNDEDDVEQSAPRTQNSLKPLALRSSTSAECFWFRSTF